MYSLLSALRRKCTPHAQRPQSNPPIAYVRMAHDSAITLPASHVAAEINTVPQSTARAQFQRPLLLIIAYHRMTASFHYQHHMCKQKDSTPEYCRGLYVNAPHPGQDLKPLPILSHGGDLASPTSHLTEESQHLPSTARTLSPHNHNA